MAIRIDKPNAEDNLSYRQKKEEDQRIELAAKDKKKTLRDLLGKDFKSTGLIKILPNETLEQAIKRLLREQRKRSN